MFPGTELKGGYSLQTEKYKRKQSRPTYTKLSVQVYVGFTFTRNIHVFSGK
jgi:hypothetical protein